MTIVVPCVDNRLQVRLNSSPSAILLENNKEQTTYLILS